MLKNEEVAQIIATIKYKEGLKQSEIAARIGIKPTYLSDVINGRCPFSDELKQKIHEQFSYIAGSQQMNGNGNVQIGGDANNVNAGETINRLVALLEKKDEQIDRLLSLLEKK